MQYGFSNYSFWSLLESGALSLEGLFEWLHQNGCDHVELADFALDLHQPGMPERVAELAALHQLSISAYSAGSSIAQLEGQAYEAELARLKGEIDIAHRAGAPLLRSDLVKVLTQRDATDIEEYERLFPIMVKSAQALADYAAQYGMEVTVENHGTLMNGGDRVRRLILAVDRPNYGCTLDVGNAVCVDEDPLVCVQTLLPFAKRIHIKDFYIREDAYAIGARFKDGYEVGGGPRVLGNGSWLTTKHKRYLRGAIVGHGDLALRGILQEIVASGYDGHLTIEFEGMEEPMLACRIGMQNLKQLTALAEE
ncbi:MAG: sugar phosphate isomerase/epimerase [Lachnospiraceae bacterium]|nr:sugar phosphate isomerase/epimerase [Lachnospiraceae bacterium]